jgi:hypothetical protein
MYSIRCTTSVSNRSGQPTSCPSLDQKYNSVHLQDCLQPGSAPSLRAKPTHLAICRKHFPGFTWPVRCNIRFWSWSSLFKVSFRYPNANCTYSIFVHYCIVWTDWQPVEWKQREKCSQPHSEHQHQQSFHNVGCCIMGTLRADRKLIVMKVV